MGLEEYMLPAVAIICYCACYIVKKTSDERLDRFIPLLAGGLGVMCSVVLAVSAGINTDNIVNIVCAGLVSGLAATGAWESLKVIKKD